MKSRLRFATLVGLSVITGVAGCVSSGSSSSASGISANCAHDSAVITGGSVLRRNLTAGAFVAPPPITRSLPAVEARDLFTRTCTLLRLSSGNINRRFNCPAGNNSYYFLSFYGRQSSYPVFRFVLESYGCEVLGRAVGPPPSTGTIGKSVSLLVLRHDYAKLIDGFYNSLVKGCQDTSCNESF
jgi:hypothetical protein